MKEHEEGLIKFVVKNKQDRERILLATPNKRKKFISHLGHYDLFDETYCIQIKYRDPIMNYNYLVSLGSPEKCYAISEMDNIDGGIVNLLDALILIIGSDFGTVISCIPGKLAFYEGENERYILNKT